MAETLPQAEIHDESLQHPSPETSPEHRALRAAARKAGKDEETLRDLLWLINAHDRLLGLRRIASNLLKILAPILARLSSEDDLAIFRGWPEVLGWIADTYGVEEISAGSTRRWNPILKFGITRNPFYAVLWEGPDDERWIARYRLLQGHLLWAHASYLYKESKHNPNVTRYKYEAYGEKIMWKAFPNSPYDATLTVSKLADPGWGPLLRELTLNTSPEGFARALSEVECPEQVKVDLGTNEDWLVRRPPLLSFIENAIGMSLWGKSDGGHVGSRQSNKRVLWSVDITPGDEDDPDSCWPRGRWLTISNPLDEKETDKILASDLDPEELAPPEDSYLSDQESPAQDPQQVAVRSALAARGQCRHVQLAHQMLPWQYNHLTVQELACLLLKGNEVFNEFSKLQEWSEDLYSAAELVALIHVMLWTGSSLDRACKLKLLMKDNSEQFRAEQINDADLLFDMDKLQWRIHAASPLYRSVILDPGKQAHPLAASFCLPDVARTGSFLLQILEQRARNQAQGADASLNFNEDEAPRYMFEGATEDFRKRLEEWLRVKANNLTGRVTISRISSFLFNRLVAATGDVMAAVSITGHTHPLARTQRYYSAYSVAELQSIYFDVSTEMLLQTHVDSEPTAPQPVPPPSLDRTAPVSPQSLDGSAVVEEYVGSRLCARNASVKEAIRKLHKEICELAQSKDRAESIAFHNLYTLHCVLLFGFSTSMRAIRTPYLWLNKVDEITGFALISDKDDDAQHKSRLAWVPPFVREQMRSYEDHCFAMALNNSQTFDWPEPCFFLEDNEKPSYVRPKTLGDKMSPFLALPPNLHRRFMRHELLGARCPPEVVNAWLGHAFQGEEPWGPHSSFSFSDYRNTLEIYLLPVLEELGWKHLRSPLA